MHQTSIRARLLGVIVAGAALLGGCAASKSTPNTLYDFGAATSTGETPTGAPLPTIVITDVTGSSALDSERMGYRLNYADPLQARIYANSRWNATPLQMITQRLKARVAQAGVKVLSATDASSGVPMLRVEVDDFTHSFDSPARSNGELQLRASLFDGHTLIDQRSFSRKTGADSADAAGGARALAASTDSVAADIMAWLATLPRR